MSMSEPKEPSAPSRQQGDKQNYPGEAAVAAERSSKQPKVDFKQKSIEEFGLKVCLKAQPKEDADDNNLTWKNYYDYRCKIRQEDQEFRRKIADRDYDEQYGYLPKDLQEEFLEAANSVGGESAQDWIRSTTMSTLECTVGYTDEVRSSSYRSCVFSPYQIPHAIVFTHRYHKRVHMSSMEFSMCWAFKLVRFDGKGPGDATQKKLNKYYPGNTFFFDDPEYDGETGEEYICSNSLIDPPNDKFRWVYCENPEARNLNPTTITRIREWLYGAPFFLSRSLISDFDLMRLVFASMGSPDFDIWMGDIGHTWAITPEHPAASHLQEAGHMEVEWDDFTKINWLEHAVRVASQNLRPLDMYYEPYDQHQPKSVWGREVLQSYEDEERHYGEDEEEEEEDRLLRQVPWMVWDREKRNKGGMGSDKMAGLMTLLGSMMQQPP